MVYYKNTANELARIIIKYRHIILKVAVKDWSL